MQNQIDIVLEGGGVRCVGLCGAITYLADQGYRFRRVAGNSAGAFTGAFLAALEARGEPPQRVTEIARGIPYHRFADCTSPAGRMPVLRPFVEGLHLARNGGLHDGDALHEWIADKLAALGVHTFRDLRLPDDEAAGLPPEQRYRLVVIASDLTLHRPVRLPWDYPMYGLDPDEQPVADAIRMSTSIPFYFKPVHLYDSDGAAHVLVDGGVFTNYPITIFDPPDGEVPDHPAIGVRLVARNQPPNPRTIHGPLSLALGLMDSVMGAWDAMHVHDQAVIDRTIFVDTSHCGVNAVSFDIKPHQEDLLLDSGRAAAAEFHSAWNPVGRMASTA
jgi:NTE family protein